MKNILTSFIILLISSNISAQNWVLVNSNTTADIRSVYFKNDTLGFFITNFGDIYKSNDAGLNWIFLHHDSGFIDNFNPNYPTKEISVVATNDSLFAYYNIHPKSVRISSSLTTIAFTKDTLNTTINKPLFWNNELWYVEKVNKVILGNNTGIVTEDYTVSNNYIWGTNATKIIYSNDFGVNWQTSQFTTNLLSSGPYQSFYDGTNQMVAITQYPTNIYKTIDAINWSFFNPALDSLYYYFIDSHNYLAYFPYSNSAKIYYTSDSGVTMISENLIDNPLGIYSKNNNNQSIFLYGKNGMLYKSTNGGGLLLLDNFAFKNNFTIYPNPVDEIIYVQNPDKLDIQFIHLMDISGKIIKTYTNQTEQLDISTIASGNYLLFIQTSKQKVVKKVIIK